MEPESQMRAWTYTSPGECRSILKLASLRRPSTAPKHHVLVKVTHAALNPSSAMIMRIIPNPFRTPRIAEMDFSGIIDVVGEGVRAELCRGTRVFGAAFQGPLQIILLRMDQGTLAEYIVVHQDLVAVVPNKVSLQEAAGFTAAGTTAVRFLDYAKLGPGDSVLINGGSGGVGTFLVQMAKHIVGPSGFVVATCSAANVDMVKSVGADEAIDYNRHKPLEEYLAARFGQRKFTSIIDTVGIQSLYSHCPAYLAEDKPYLDVGVSFSHGETGFLGGLASLIPNMLKNYFWPTILGGTPRTFRLLSTTPDVVMMEKVRRLAEQGVIKTVVDSVWAMEDVVVAYEKLETRRARGKIIIEIQKDHNV